MKLRCFTFCLPLLAANLFATDWPQYRGSNHDGSSPEKIAGNWPQGGPRIVWKVPLGPSFGSFVVKGAGRAFCFIQRSVEGRDREVAVAFDANTGKELWSVPLGEPTYDKQGGDGPRSTPTVDGDRVYFLGVYLVLSCLDAATGKLIWQHDLTKEYGGKVIRWNSAASPILDGNLIFVNAGGAGQALLAFDNTDGKLVWKGQDDQPTHSSPVPVTIDDVRQVIFFTNGLVSVAAATGQVLWRYPFPFKTSTAMSPVVWQDIVYCSTSYGIGAAAVRISKSGAGFKVTELWRQEGKLINQWTTPVCKDGYLYGLYGAKEFGTGPLNSIEIETGKEMWSQPGFGSGGATILVEDDVLVQSDHGPLVLVEATPKGFHELARAQVLSDKCWTMPVFSNGRIFARNTQEGVCLDLSPTAGK